MSGAKVTRWIDLLAALLARRLPVPFEELVRAVPAYAQNGSPEALRRMFERDKKDLRALGVPLETVGPEGAADAAYTIRRADFYLPHLAVQGQRTDAPDAAPGTEGYRALPRVVFEPDELALVSAAVDRVGQLGHPELAADAERALDKLQFDLPVLGSMLPRDTRYLPPRARAKAETLKALGEALRARKGVTFDYLAMSTGVRERRHAEPWGLYFLGGHWYLAARDVERGALRNFRVNRIGKLTVNSRRPGTPDYEIPPTFDLREHARARQPWELGEGDAVEVEVSFRGETGAVVAARALGAPVPGHPERRRFEVRRVDAFVRWLLSFGGDARPLAPAAVVGEYRDQVRDTAALYAEPQVQAVRAPVMHFLREMSPPPAEEHLQRLLTLLPHLADGKERDLDETAQRLGTTPDQLLADLTVLAERYDVPGGYVEPVQVFIQQSRLSVWAPLFRRPMRLTIAELGALDLGFALLRGERPAADTPAIDRARERLRIEIGRVAAEDERPPLVHAGTVTGPWLERLSVIREARRTGHKVRLTYRSGDSSTSTTRTICPYQLIEAEAMWYVAARCEQSGGLRFFRADRIEGAEPLPDTFTPPEELPVTGVFRAEAATTLRIRYGPRIARWVAEREGMNVDPDGSLTRELPLADPNWAVRHVLQYGRDAEALEPDELREELARRLEAILAGD